MTFRERLVARELLAGTWVKTPHPHIAEVLALSGLDVLVLDAEHAPFDRAALDQCILAARAGGPTSGALVNRNVAYKGDKTTFIIRNQELLVKSWIVRNQLWETQIYSLAK